MGFGEGEEPLFQKGFLPFPNSRKLIQEKKMASLKKTLASGGRAIGSWLTLPSPAIAEIMANAGYDWLACDLEHASLDLSQCAELMRATSLAGAEPMVRSYNFV